MITAASITKVKYSVSLVSVVESYVELKRSGSRMTGCCPFHGEKTPSFFVNEAHGFYKCFGCGAAGDAINFIMAIERLPFYEAVEHLAERNGIELEYEREYIDPATRQKAKEAAAKANDVLLFVADFYHKALMCQPDDAYVWQQLAQRGITRDMAARWQMGFAPDLWENLSLALAAKGMQEQAQELGLLKEGQRGLIDAYRSRLIIPSRNHKGELNGFIGRLIGNNDKAPKYINPSESPLYNKYRELFGIDKALPGIKEHGFAYIVEGNIDVVMMHEHGMDNTVCPGGTALTSEQCTLLRRYTDTVCIITDGDTEGQNAAMKWIDIALMHDLVVKLIALPPEHDPDSFVRSLARKYASMPVQTTIEETV